MVQEALPACRPEDARPDDMARTERRRILAIDVVRGLAIVGMLLVNDAGIPWAMPSQLRHAPWQGLTVADVVFPLFLFTVGASMPFSERAQRPRAVLRRVGGLVVLGSLLVSAKQLHLAPSTGVLQQIAGAYLLAWLALRLPRRAQLPAGLAVLAGLWVAYTFLPPGGNRAGAWAPGSNLADLVDRHVLGQFSEHGVLVMVASSVTVLTGVAAGRVLRERHDRSEVTMRLSALGMGTLAAGVAAAVAVPLSKPLWSPSYVLVTAGVAYLATAAAYRLVDHGPGSRWARPLLALGNNALAGYTVSVLLFAFMLKPWQTDLVRPLERLAGAPFAAVAYASATVVVIWAMAEWLYRRRIFVKL
jgi:predicted acyltransferase